MLLRHLLRAGPWLQWLPVTVLIALILWATSELFPDFASRQLYFRAALLVAALGICFVYDDPASETSDPTPSPLLKRRSIRTLLGITTWAGLVALTLIVAARGMDPVLVLSEEISNPFPVGRVLLEGSTMAAWGLAIAAVIAKRRDDEPGKFSSVALIAIYAISWMIPDQWKPWADPSDPRWDTALPYWWLALTLGLTVVLAFSWDSRVGWRLRRQPTGGESAAATRVDSRS